MAATRKLQGEIDRCLKKVTEGVETFEDIWQKVHNATNSNQKEKYEADLKKEIKKLQRLRDQIKSWIASGEIKDKSTLLDYRKLIETQMERFKVVERETKTKAYSKEGLGAAQKLDPAQKEREEIVGWLVSSIDALNLQIDQFESEIESLLAGKKKRLDKDKQDRMEELKQKLEKHRFHIRKLETLLRMLDNMSVEVNQIRRIKDDVEYYIESSQDPDFEENEYIYDDIIGLDDVELQASGAGVPSGSANTTEDSTNNSIEMSPSSPTSLTSISPTTNNQLITSPTIIMAAAAAAAAASANTTATSLTQDDDLDDKQKKVIKPMPVRPTIVGTAASTTTTTATKLGKEGNFAAVVAVKSQNSENGTSSGGSISSTSSSSNLLLSVQPPTISNNIQQTSINNIINTSNTNSNSSNCNSSSGVVSGSTPSNAIPSSHSGVIGSSLTAQQQQHLQQQAAAAQQQSLNVVVGLGILSQASGPPSCLSSTLLDNHHPTTNNHQSSITTSLTTTHNNCVSPLSSTASSRASPPPSTLNNIIQPQPQPTSATATVTSILSSNRNNTTPSPLVNGPVNKTTESMMSTLKSIAQQAIDRAGLEQQPPSEPQQRLTTPTQQQQQPSSTTSQTIQFVGDNNINHLNNNNNNKPTNEALVPPLLGVAPLGPVPLQKEHQCQFQMMEAAYYHMPHPAESEKLRQYIPRNHVQTPSYYQQSPLPHSDTVEFYQRLSTETLFFVFYYMEGTKAQYLAAKALKKQSWRFHTKYMMWFQRHEEPKIINEEYEQGTYIYFDYEKWGQRKKEGFTFEYKFLEDRDLN